jgi:hypothetical protein
MAELHILQTETVTLLKQLYELDNLRLTSAMLLIQKDYYPSVDKVLSTLYYYKDEDRVKRFLEKNQELVEDAQKQIDEIKAETIQAEKNIEKSKGAVDTTSSWDSYSNFSKREKIFNKLKSIKYVDLEESLSDMFSKKLNDKIVVSIDDVNHNGDIYPENVEIKIVLSESNVFDPDEKITF